MIVFSKDVAGGRIPLSGSGWDETDLGEQKLEVGPFTDPVTNETVLVVNEYWCAEIHFEALWRF